MSGGNLQILSGDCREVLKSLADESVQCCVTSPPYWGLRSYLPKDHPLKDKEIGQERTPDEYVATMVEVFREVRRVLRDDGTLWLNLGDSYASAWACDRRNVVGNGSLARGKRDDRPNRLVNGLKEKDLVGIPWRVAFALQQDGWWLRQDIIWHKPNPMPESVTDRPTKSHEYLFLMSKAERYFYDAQAIKEPLSASTLEDPRMGRERYEFDGKTLAREKETGGKELCASFWSADAAGRNKRSVWTVTTNAYPEAHFATYPPALITPCILAGTSAKGCCPKCGAPFERIIEYERQPRGDNFGKRNPYETFDRGQQGTAYQQIVGSKTVGWSPTCRCDDAASCNGQIRTGLHSQVESAFVYSENKPIPCTVLDPFGGSGTTGQVALELGRKAILIELNPAYQPLIDQRTNVTPGLGLV